MSMCELSNLVKTFTTGVESLTIINGLNLTIKEGEVITITGESGSGKSTLLNLIGGLDTATRGEIQVAGVAVSNLKEKELSWYRSTIIGFIFQFHYLLKDFSSMENVMLPGLVAGMKKEKAKARALELLEMVKLLNRADHFPATLSGGERQRAAVARALMNDPKIILADEPTGNLDKKNSKNVEDILFELVRTYGKTLVLVSHDPEICDKGERKFSLEGGTLLKL